MGSNTTFSDRSIRRTDISSTYRCFRIHIIRIPRRTKRLHPSDQGHPNRAKHVPRITIPSSFRFRRHLSSPTSFTQAYCFAWSSKHQSISVVKRNFIHVVGPFVPACQTRPSVCTTIHRCLLSHLGTQTCLASKTASTPPAGVLKRETLLVRPRRKTLRES